MESATRTNSFSCNPARKRRLSESECDCDTDQGGECEGREQHGRKHRDMHFPGLDAGLD